jgi:hypothetical protein
MRIKRIRIPNTAENYLLPPCELSKLPYTERRKVRLIGSLPFWLCKLGSGGEKLRYIIFKERGNELFPLVFLRPPAVGLIS